MALTQDQIAHIAKLSKLSLSEERLENYRNTLDEVVGYIDMLGTVSPADLERAKGTDASGILPLRADAVSPSDADRDSLLATSPQKVIASQIAIPNIMG